MLISFTYYMFEISLMEYTQLTVKRVILLIVKYIILLIPPLNFSLTFEKFLMSWRVNNKISAYAQHGLNEMRFHASGKKFSKDEIITRHNKVFIRKLINRVY